MVHSIAAAGSAVFALQNETLVKYNAEKHLEKSIPSDMTTIRASDRYVVGLVNNTKEARVYDHDLELVATHEFPKRPSALSLRNKDLVVADKFGDVFKTKVDAPITDLKNLPAISGHVSMVLDVVLLGRYLIASDRDEHIRVSRFPDAFVIEQFLLGHTSFVSHLAVSGNLLVSGGGDPFVLIWNFAAGELLGRIEVGKPVIGLEISDNQVFILPELSEEVLIADLQTFEVKETRTFAESVTCLGNNGTVLFGLSNRVDGYAELEGETQPVSEEALRKTAI